MTNTSTEIEIRILLLHDVYSPNLYRRLGLDSSASNSDIKRAYRYFACEYHPDKEGYPQCAFQLLGEAYTTLSNVERRKLYDQFGDMALQHREVLTEALHLLPQLLMQSLRDHQFKTSVDYFAKLREYVRKEVRDLTKQLQLLNSAAKKLRNMEKRIKKKAGTDNSNIFQTAFEREYQLIAQQLDTNKKQTFLYTVAGKIIDDYWFELDQSTPEIHDILQGWTQSTRSHRFF